MKILLTYLLLIIVGYNSFAQEIKGTVTDENKLPIPEVNITSAPSMRFALSSSEVLLRFLLFKVIMTMSTPSIPTSSKSIEYLSEVISERRRSDCPIIVGNHSLRLDSIPRCLSPAALIILPLGVLTMSPCLTRNCSTTASMVSGYSPTSSARVLRPIGLPSNFLSMGL